MNMSSHPSNRLSPTTESLHVPGYEVPTGAVITNTREAFLQALEGRIHATNGTPTLIAIDGPPGGGKTHVIEAIKDQLSSRPGWSTIVHGMDNHLGTAPDTPERDRLLRSDMDFEELYCNDEEAARVISELLKKPAGESVELGTVYSRAERGFIKGSPIPVPGGKKVVILEGTGTLGIAEKVAEEVPKAEMIKVFVLTQLITAWRAKMLRDFLRKIDARPAFHKRDINMATRLRCVPNMQDPSTLFFDNTATLEAALR